mmetsp:Transcript_28120/g.62730  ORF Transcript_28120/g.62730 Transcript_28120/m.62730 type:complete len:212 (-) Transcript_28120:426-1061(-)
MDRPRKPKMTRTRSILVSCCCRRPATFSSLVLPPPPPLLLLMKAQARALTLGNLGPASTVRRHAPLKDSEGDASHTRTVLSYEAVTTCSAPATRPHPVSKSATPTTELPWPSRPLIGRPPLSPSQTKAMLSFEPVATRRRPPPLAASLVAPSDRPSDRGVAPLVTRAETHRTESLWPRRVHQRVCSVSFHILAVLSVDPVTTRLLPSGKLS